MVRWRSGTEQDESRSARIFVVRVGEVHSIPMDSARGAPRSVDAHGQPLSLEQRHVLWEGGTETPFVGKYWNTHESGMYTCVSCGADLFSSDAKFDSGTGWPAFTEPANREHIDLVEDRSHGMTRTEVRCKHCGAHLGHVFDDGPIDRGGKRYCINSVCLDLHQQDRE